MLSQDGRYVIVYNGQIYNYLELKKKLIVKGYQFATRSDTEVLLYWLVEHGISGLPELNGMFGFGFWDHQEKSLLLARDRLGIKPVYYYTGEKDTLIFASEIKAILPLIPKREADVQAIYEFLTFQNIISDKTFFQSIHKLIPGHWLRWTPSGVTSGSFWEVNFPRDHQGSYPDVIREYKEVLENSVGRHMISDVPVGAYLSGGFDSSSVSTVASQLMSDSLHTFTGAFTDGPYYDERVGSRAVNKSIGAVAHEVEIAPQDYLNNIGKVIYHLDEPTLGTGAFPQYMVSQLVSRFVKVVLTGHGGDEMFAGYQVNKVALLKETLKQNPGRIGSVLKGIRKDEWTRVLYYLFYPLLHPEICFGLYILVPKRKRTSFFTPDFLERNKDFEPLDCLNNFIERNNDLPGERLLRLYLRTYLPTLFIQEDKVGMAHSIEARTPLCDNEMVDLALSVPLQIKLWNNNLKAVTKGAMEPRLPAILHRLPKRGFPTPFARWYRQDPLKSFMADLLLSKKAEERGIFNISALQKIFRRNLRSKNDNLYDYARANVIYSSSIVELWFRTFIDQTEPTPIC
jgi:asparagine synthase (glutamine-hydrolysing)